MEFLLKARFVSRVCCQDCVRLRLGTPACIQTRHRTETGELKGSPVDFQLTFVAKKIPEDEVMIQFNLEQQFDNPDKKV